MSFRIALRRDDFPDPTVPTIQTSSPFLISNEISESLKDLSFS
jgi:hypothetical protein